MTSLWLDRERPSYPAFGAAAQGPEPELDALVVEQPGGERRYDVVVAGGGLTGLTAAVLFARAGRSVALLEGRRIGDVTTGNTTAKLSLLQGVKLSRIAKKQSQQQLQRYVDANREGQAWLLHYLDEHGVAYQRRPAYTYAGTPRARAAVQAERDACVSAGLDVAWQDETELPFPTFGTVRLDDQAQFDPLDVLEALTADLLARGGSVFEHTRVQGARVADGVQVRTEHGTLRAGHLVLATGVPILDRGGFFARLQARRSYVAAFRVPGPVPVGMYLSADEPTRSLRTAPFEADELLVVGGNGHVVGREPGTRRQVDDLIAWTERHFPGAEATHTWSAQDYSPIAELPFVGPLTPTSDRILVATGYDKWGMTNAVAAALALTGRVLGGHQQWAEALQSWSRSEVTGIPTAAKENAAVAYELVKGWVAPVVGGSAAEPDEGGGIVQRGVPTPVAVCKVDGEVHRRSAVCPHLGGVVSWNDAERSWDCPLHGSRFAPDGAVLEGPATHGLAAAR